MTTVKTSQLSLSSPRAFSATRRCAVEDTGRNSLKPSRNPRKIALTMSFMAPPARGELLRGIVRTCECQDPHLRGKMGYSCVMLSVAPCEGLSFEVDMKFPAWGPKV